MRKITRAHHRLVCQALDEVTAQIRTMCASLEQAEILSLGNLDDLASAIADQSILIARLKGMTGDEVNVLASPDKRSVRVSTQAFSVLITMDRPLANHLNDQDLQKEHMRNLGVAIAAISDCDDLILS
jgi:hypothetical protein